MKPGASTYRPDPEQIHPIGSVVDAIGAATPLIQGVNAVLGSGGVLEQNLPGFQVRTPQLALARTWCRGLELGRTAVVQAGTGTGKSIGYLVPSILWALGRTPPATVLVSTATKLLQRQLMDDLAELAKHIPELTFAKLEGRRNYVCAAKLQDDPRGLEFEDEYNELMDWAATTETGELAELRFDIHQERFAPIKRAVTVQDDECPGARRCPDGGECAYFLARQKAVGVTVVVVNHALLCLHLRRGGLLPDFHAVVVDEAHQLEQYARAANEGQLGSNRFARLLKTVKRAELPVDVLRPELLTFQGFLDKARAPGERFPWAFDRPVWEDMAGHLTGFLDVLEDLQKMAEDRVDREEGYIWRLLHAKDQLEELEKDIHHLLDCSSGEPEVVAWAERAKHVTARVMPTDVSSWLKEQLFKPRPVLLTSATLTTTNDERGWDYSRNSLGWSTSLRLPVESPFNWRKQLLYYVPDDLPRDLHGRDRHGKPIWTAEQKAQLYIPIYRRVLAATKGRAFLLFTSYEMLNAVRDALRCIWREYDFSVQGEASKEETVALFKSAARPVLLATKTFWEGVDIPGSQLSCVIVDAIPFESPTDPLEQALSCHLTTPEKLVQRAIPQATLHLKQAFGRLIRRTTDRGLAVPMDPRFRFAAYGPRMLGALQAGPTLQTTVTAEQLPAVGAWLETAATL